MAKYKLETLANVAKAHGYTGAVEGEAVKSWLLAQTDLQILGNDGQPIDIKSVEIVTAKPSKKSVSVIEDDGETETKSVQADDTSDLDVKIKAASEAAVKAAGFDTAKDRPSIGVRDGADIRYEAWAKSNGRDPFGGDIKRARMYHDLLRLKVCNSITEFRNSPVVKSIKNRLQSGVYGKAYATTPDAAGGAAVFDQFLPEFINNVNQYGASRGPFGARVVAMSSDSMDIPVKTGLHTVSYPGEGSAATASTGIGYSRQNLRPSTGIVLVRATREVLDDAAIDLAGDHFQEIARSFAYYEDYRVYMANGEATYAGDTGLSGAFGTLTLASAASASVGGDTWSAHTDTHLSLALSKVPSYARNRLAWYCTPEFSAAVFTRLSRAAGGVNFMEMEGRGLVQTYMGRPIIENNVMNSDDDTGTDTIDAYVGDMSRAVIIGDRMSLELTTNDSLYYDSYEIAIRGVVRTDVIVSDIGSTTVRGPLVAFWQT